MKKLFGSVVSLLLSLILLAGCGPSSNTPVDDDGGASESHAQTDPIDNGSVIDLDFWHTLTGDDGTVLGKMVEDFNSEYEGSIHVNVQAMNSSDFKTKVPMVIEAGEGIPDVSVLTSGTYKSYAQQGLLMQMDDLIADIGLSADDFAPKIWDIGVTADGSRYSIPLDAHSMLMYYNEDILSELGYTPNDLQNLSTDQFMKMCMEATDAGYSGVTVWWGWMDYMFCTYLVQNGGETVSVVEPTKPLFNSDIGVEAVDYFKGLYDAGVTNGLDIHPETMFQQGDSLFCFTGTWAVSGMDAISGLNWGLAFPPLFGDDNVVWAGSHNLVMYEKDYTPERLEAVTTFVKWISDHGADWANSGSMPARLDILESADYKSYKWSFAADDIDKFVFAPSVLTASSITTSVDSNIYDYYLGNIPTAKEALDRAAEDGAAKAEKTLASINSAN